jgi:hypothetical protein
MQGKKPLLRSGCDRRCGWPCFPCCSPVALRRARKHRMALAKGEHAMLAGAPYAFSRVHPGDRVVVAIGASGATQISVRQAFAERQAGCTMRTRVLGCGCGGKWGEGRSPPIRAGRCYS